MEKQPWSAIYWESSNTWNAAGENRKMGIER